MTTRGSQVLLGLILFAQQPLFAGTNTALPPFASGTFVGFGADALRTTTVAGGSVVQDVLPPGSFSLSYDGSTQSYTIRHSTVASSTTFGPADLRSSTASDVTYSTAPTYTVGTGSNFTSLTLLLNAPVNSKIDLSYTSYAIGYTQSHLGVGQDTVGSYGGVLGQATSLAALPRGGGAYYSGVVDGYAGTSRLSGTGDLLANFYSGEIATGLNLTAGGTFIGRIDGRGSILSGASEFSGDLFGSGNGFLGRFAGSFFGPAAQEVGYGFSLSESGGGSAVGGVLVATQMGLPSPPLGTSNPSVPSGNPNATLVGPLASESFATNAGRLIANPAGTNFSSYSGTSATVAEALDTGALTISYDASTASYTVADSVAKTTFTPTNRDAGGDRITTRYTVTGYLSGQHLTLLNEGASNPYIQLSYLSYGLWTDGEDVQQKQNNYRAFIYGVETPVGNLPRSGAALYNGGVDGFWSVNGATYRLQGSDGSILANFFTGEVRTTLRLAAVGTGTGSVPMPLRVDGYGSITVSTAHFAGAAATADGSYSGRFQGAFYGPAYQEAGASFVLRGPSSTSSIAGVLVATQVPPH